MVQDALVGDGLCGLGTSERKESARAAALSQGAVVVKFLWRFSDNATEESPRLIIDSESSPETAGVMVAKHLALESLDIQSRG